MTLRLFIHSVGKRAETTVLLDSGASENFMHLDYARTLGLPIQNLDMSPKLYNMDGTENKAGELQYYTDLCMQTGTQHHNLRFYLSNLGDHKCILRYPWLAAVQPRIDWRKGWIDYEQLPVVLQAKGSEKTWFMPWTINKPRPLPKSYIGSAEPNNKTGLARIPKEFWRHKKVFSEQASQQLTKHTKWDHSIKLLPDALATLPGRLLPLNQEELREQDNFVNEHLSWEMIWPSKGPYTSNYFFVKKKDGKLRPVQDYRPLNKWTKKDRNVSPLIPEVIDRLSGCTQFTKFNIRWGYNNIHIKEGDEWKAVFLTRQGLFKPLVMFFGLTNSLATFQQMMNTIFREEVSQGWLSVYMDNLAIHTKPEQGETEETHWQQHHNYIYHILDKLEEHDLYLKPEKCEFKLEQMEYLGMVVGRNTLQMDKKKMDQVKSWNPPRNPMEVQKFLGLTGYYCYFIKDYLKLAWPLLDLTKKAFTWMWDERQKDAFQALKQQMCSWPVLTQPNFKQCFYLQMDTSGYGMGAILSQEGGTNDLTEEELHTQKLKPKLHPITYYLAMFIPTVTAKTMNPLTIVYWTTVQVG
jgi:hypothetical protein